MLNSHKKFLDLTYVQIVGLQHQHRLTDDVATDQWRHPQHAIPVNTTW